MDLSQFPGYWRDHFQSICTNIEKFEQKKYFDSKNYIGKTILDFGGSGGQFAAALLLKGASKATLIDPAVPKDLVEPLSSIPGMQVIDGFIEDYVIEKNQSFDFIVSHSVTEHIEDLPKVLDSLKGVLKKGGLFFIAHDNYYHASGAHDNLILQIGPNGHYGYQGPKCWETGKCEVSSDFRIAMTKTAPFLWGQESNEALKDGNCLNCSFKKRTNPWAHLLFQDHFKEVYKEPMFSTSRENGVLNKITPFQLKQFLVEAGFKIVLWERSFVNNPIPEELLLAPFFFSAEDLLTENVFVCVSS